MTTVHREMVIDAEPDRAWAVIGDFANGPTAMAPGFVTGCRLASPDVRVVTFVNGDVAWERLVAIDESTRRIVWSVFDGWTRPAHDNASFQVFAEGTDRTRLVWIHDVLPDELATSFATAMDGGLEVIERTLARRAPGPVHR